MPRSPPASSGSVPIAVLRGSMSETLSAPSSSFTALIAVSSRLRIIGLVAASATMTTTTTTISTIKMGVMGRDANSGCP